MLFIIIVLAILVALILFRMLPVLIIALVLIVANIPTKSHADGKKEHKEACITLLGGSFYNTILESICPFDGDVAAKFKVLYTKGNCSKLVSKKEFDSLAKDVLLDTKKRANEMGIPDFCEGNKEAYFDILKGGG